MKVLIISAWFVVWGSTETYLTNELYLSIPRQQVSATRYSKINVNEFKTGQEAAKFVGSFIEDDSQFRGVTGGEVLFVFEGKRFKWKPDFKVKKKEVIEKRTETKKFLKSVTLTNQEEKNK